MRPATTYRLKIGTIIHSGARQPLVKCVRALSAIASHRGAKGSIPAIGTLAAALEPQKRRPFFAAEPPWASGSPLSGAGRLLKNLIIILVKRLARSAIVGFKDIWSACNVRRQAKVPALFDQSSRKVRDGIRGPSP